jgi:hypothetical protein
MSDFAKSFSHLTQSTCLVGGFGVRYSLDKHQTVLFQLRYGSQPPRVRLKRFVRDKQLVVGKYLELVPWLLAYIAVESRKLAVSGIPHEIFRRVERLMTGPPFDP